MTSQQLIERPRDSGWDVLALCGRLVFNYYGIDDPHWPHDRSLCATCKKKGSDLVASEER